MILTNLLRCCMRSHPSSHLCFDDWHEFSYVNFFISYCSSLFTSFFDFYCFETVFSSNSKDTGKTRENGWGCGNLTNFLQRKIKRCQWRVSNFERYFVVTDWFFCWYLLNFHIEKSFIIWPFCRKLNGILV